MRRKVSVPTTHHKQPHPTKDNCQTRRISKTNYTVKEVKRKKKIVQDTMSTTYVSADKGGYSFQWNTVQGAIGGVLFALW
jgi:hypothetical protein